MSPNSEKVIYKNRVRRLKIHTELLEIYICIYIYIYQSICLLVHWTTRAQKYPYKDLILYQRSWSRVKKIKTQKHKTARMGEESQN